MRACVHPESIASRALAPTPPPLLTCHVAHAVQVLLLERGQHKGLPLWRQCSQSAQAARIQIALPQAPLRHHAVEHTRGSRRQLRCATPRAAGATRRPSRRPAGAGGLTIPAWLPAAAITSWGTATARRAAVAPWRAAAATGRAAAAVAARALRPRAALDDASQEGGDGSDFGALRAQRRVELAQAVDLLGRGQREQQPQHAVVQLVGGAVL